MQGIPRALDAIVLRARARERAERYQSAGELQLALEDFIVDQRMSATPAHLAIFMRELYAEAPSDDESTQADAPRSPSRRRPSGA